MKIDRRLELETEALFKRRKQLHLDERLSEAQDEALASWEREREATGRLSRGAGDALAEELLAILERGII